MKQAAGKVQAAHGQINKIKNQLHGHQAELMGAWKGESAVAFAKVFQLFDSEFAKVLQDLNIIHQKLVDTQLKYQAAEGEKNQTISPLHGLLNGGV
ncbi:WXG100 family type VII secretion target [Actinomadura craniellae]|uniref:ESAT-6-like protein n=1 Tax=Actinomadura craniellae TaxID=2231787 RepID=A0A365GX96_9ACTN|nr:WXG100 family type VII secretion target [Actinomadura craniellae]RAY11454.1 WXG100 family type VII secretion target [Actinomadura craniellae]